ncbi:CvpA family protein [Pleionea sediminis]|uniref:CvpA family protein n=1 Tax=Pleionea sediminis TaxID=2569479 RepID=UPI001184E5D9|nr:CvpA family protein [Pleionea sediminis]
MAIFTLILIVSIVLFGFLGYKKGIIKLTFRLLSLLGAYASAILFTADLADYLNENSPLNGILGFIVAGITLFILTSIILSLLFGLIEKMINKTGFALSQASQIAGGVAGVVFGGVLGILLIWFISVGGQLLNQKTMDVDALAQKEEASGIEKMAREMTSSAIKSAISMTTDQPEIAELTAQILESPEESLAHLRGISGSNEFRELFLSARNQQILNTGDVEQIKRIPAFNQLMANEHFQAISKGVIENDSELPAADQMAEKMRDMWARAQFVRNDPEAQAVVNDPQLRELINQGSVIELLNSQKITDLFKRIMSEEAGQYSEKLKQLAPEISTSLKRTTEESVKKSEVYKWVDENGQVHYSDKKQEQKN